MAFRRNQLLEIGGFDAQFRAAGDDVDVCWRIQQQGWKLGFNPAATVFHHRRDRLRAYWRQQVGYGKAEAILERKWPDKYNAAGYLTWTGRIYNAAGLTSLSRGRIYHGTWGSAAYQRLYQPAAEFAGSLPLLPEWYLVIAFLAALSGIGLVWKPLLLIAPLLILSAGLTLAQAGVAAWKASSFYSREGWQRLRATAFIGVLQLAQPLARLFGRFKYGLHPWRHRGAPQVTPRRKSVSIWTEASRTPEEWLNHLQTRLRSAGSPGFAGGGYDDWDLEVQGGMLGAVRTRMAIEEHGGGRQMLRFRIWPRCPATGFLTLMLLVSISVAAGYDQAWAVAALLLVGCAILGGRMLYECALAMHRLTHVLDELKTTSQHGAAAPAKTVSLLPMPRNS
jgi:hypothetical protein